MADNPCGLSVGVHDPPQNIVESVLLREGDRMEDHSVSRRLRELENQVSELLLHRAAADINALDEERLTLGDRMSDSLANAVGSWRFIGSFIALLVVWMALNVVAAVHHWDPYPFILLNLVLSCVAALQAPAIMMSQNRLETRDRLRAQNDYEVNVKAELLLEHLTEEIEILKRGLLSLGARVQEDEDESRQP
jgi:uncharacterized membrane protein